MIHFQLTNVSIISLWVCKCLNFENVKESFTKKMGRIDLGEVMLRKCRNINNEENFK